MKRGYIVHASRKNGEQLSLVLQTSDKGMLIKEGFKVVRKFSQPHVEIVQKRGKSRRLFSVDQKPAYWLNITDSDGTMWPVKCRSLSDAKAIRRWAIKNEGQREASHEV